MSTQNSQPSRIDCLTEKEAFDAMLEFLKSYYRATNIGEIFELIIQLDYLVLKQDQTPATNDAGAWPDWIAAVRAVKKERSGDL